MTHPGALLAALALAGCGGFHAIADAAVDGGPSGPDGDTTVFEVVQDNPDGGALRSVWGSSADQVYVTGDNGVMLQYDGSQWFRINLGIGSDMSGLWGAAANDVWAVGTVRASQKGILYHRTGASGWTQYGSAPYGLKSVWGVDELRFAVGLDGGIFTGTTMAPFSKGLQGQPNPDITFTEHAPINWAVSGNSRTSVMIAADVDTFVWYDGADYHQLEDPKDRTRTYRAAWGPPSGGIVDLYLGANYFGLWHFTGRADPVYQLNEEQDQSEKVGRFIWGVWGTDDGREVVCVGDEGRIMTYNVKTQLVQVRASPTNRSLYAVWGTSLDDLWIVGEGGLVLRGHISPP